MAGCSGADLPVSECGNRLKGATSGPPGPVPPARSAQVLPDNWGSCKEARERQNCPTGRCSFVQIVQCLDEL